METDREYFERRAEEERAAAKAAHGPARAAHADMADRYAGIAEALESYGRVAA